MADYPNNLSVTVLYRSLSIQSILSAVLVKSKYPAATLTDIEGLSTSEISDLITDIDDDSQDKIFVFAAANGVAETKATALITFTGAGAEGDTVTVKILNADDEEVMTLGTYIVGATPTVTSVADGVEGVIDANFGNHGYTAGNVAGALTVTAPTGSGAAQNGMKLTIAITGTVTVDTDTQAFAGGVTQTNEGNLTSAQATTLLDKLASGAYSDTAITNINGASGGKNASQRTWENLWPTVYSPVLITKTGSGSDVAAIGGAFCTRIIDDIEGKVAADLVTQLCDGPDAFSRNLNTVPVQDTALVDELLTEGNRLIEYADTGFSS